MNFNFSCEFFTLDFTSCNLLDEQTYKELTALAGRLHAEVLRNVPEIKQHNENKRINVLPAIIPAPPLAIISPETGSVITGVQSENVGRTKGVSSLSPAEPPLLDSMGRPWDERIHSRTQSLTKSGAWRPKRGVDRKVFKEIYKELKSAAKVGAVPPPPVAPPPAPPAAIVNLVPPPPAAPVASTLPAVTFVELMELITTSVNMGKVSREQIDKLLVELGIENISGFVKQAEKSALMKQKVEALL